MVKVYSRNKQKIWKNSKEITKKEEEPAKLEKKNTEISFPFIALHEEVRP